MASAPGRRGARPPVIGLAGPIGGGKSAVAKVFAALGAQVIDADRIAHEVLQRPEVRQLVSQRWGRDVLDAEGRVDRRALGRKVFEKEGDLRELEAIVHPRVRAEVMKQMHRAATAPNARAIVLDVPLLFEAGLDAWCEAVVFVDAPLAQRLERLRRRHGWDGEELARRERMQWPAERKRARAHHLIENSGSPEELRRAAEAVFEKITGGAEPRKAQSQTSEASLW